jgi:hypothetical protein
MSSVRVTWETDGESPDLPEEVEIPGDIEEEGISDFLSDSYGWLVLGWEQAIPHAPAPDRDTAKPTEDAQ